jgi:hypothetical protein
MSSLKKTKCFLLFLSLARSSSAITSFLKGQDVSVDVLPSFRDTLLLFTNIEIGMLSAAL